MMSMMWLRGPRNSPCALMAPGPVGNERCGDAALVGRNLEEAKRRVGEIRPGPAITLIGVIGAWQNVRVVEKPHGAAVERFRGELSELDPLPSIRKLAQDLQLSVITTKRAYEELERERFIDTVGGKGTFVAAQNKEFIREKRMKVVEEKLAEAIAELSVMGMTLPELQEMLTLLFQEEQ